MNKPHEICVDVTTEDDLLNLRLVAIDVGFGYRLHSIWTFMGTEFDPTNTSLRDEMFGVALSNLFEKLEHEPS